MWRRPGFWWEAVKAGAPTGWALLGSITLVGGGSLYAFLGFGVARPMWGVVLLALFVVGVFAEGRTRLGVTLTRLA